MTVSSTESTAFRAFVRLAAPFTMLLMTTALAAGLSLHRRSVRLGDSIAPEGWALSFHPPSGWSDRQIDGLIMGEVVRLDSPPESIPREVFVQRSTLRAGLTATGFAVEQLITYGQLGRAGGGMFARAPELNPTDVSFGDVGAGVLVTDESASIIVATCALDVDAYSIILRSGRPLNARDVATVYSILDSIERTR